MENEIYLSKYLTSCSFRIYMVIGVYLQNPLEKILIGVMACIFLHLQEGDALWKMKYTYPSTLRHVVSEYIWL